MVDGVAEVEGRQGAGLDVGEVAQVLDHGGPGQVAGLARGLDRLAERRGLRVAGQHVLGRVEAVLRDVAEGGRQPLEVIFGGIDAVRIRALGTGLGQAAAELDRRVLFLGSGGLCHDPPVPVLDGAPPRVADALIEGHPPTPEQRLRGEERVVEAGRAYAAGDSSMIPINPERDNAFLDVIASGEPAEFDGWSPEWMGREGGGSAHEVRTWVAAFASVAAAGGYGLEGRFYEAVPEWIAGFAVATGRTLAG